MKMFLYFIIICCAFTISCCSGSSSTRNGDVLLYRVSWENVYDCYDEREDTLLYGLTFINKEIHHYTNGEKSSFLQFLIEDPDEVTGKSYQRSVNLDEEEILQFGIFLDSCLNRNLQDESYWEMRLKSGSIFYYDTRQKSIVYWCNQGNNTGLQITPQRLKEVLTKVMEDENLRDDE